MLAAPIKPTSKAPSTIGKQKGGAAVHSLATGHEAKKPRHTTANNTKSDQNAPAVAAAGPVTPAAAGPAHHRKPRLRRHCPVHLRLGSKPEHIVVITADDVQQLPGQYDSDGSLTLCAEYSSVKGTQSCPRGLACPHVHADLSRSNEYIRHRVLPEWRTIADVARTYALLGTATDEPLTVAAPNTDDTVATVRPERCLRTRALDSERRPLSLCVHFSRRGVCDLGGDCQFIHHLSAELILDDRVRPLDAASKSLAAPCASLRTGSNRPVGAAPDSTSPLTPQNPQQQQMAGLVDLVPFDDADDSDDDHAAVCRVQRLSESPRHGMASSSLRRHFPNGSSTVGPMVAHGPVVPLHAFSGHPYLQHAAASSFSSTAFSPNHSRITPAPLPSARGFTAPHERSGVDVASFYPSQPSVAPRDASSPSAAMSCLPRFGASASCSAAAAWPAAMPSPSASWTPAANSHVTIAHLPNRDHAARSLTGFGMSQPELSAAMAAVRRSVEATPNCHGRDGDSFVWMSSGPASFSHRQTPAASCPIAHAKAVVGGETNVSTTPAPRPQHQAMAPLASSHVAAAGASMSRSFPFAHDPYRATPVGSMGASP